MNVDSVMIFMVTLAAFTMLGVLIVYARVRQYEAKEKKATEELLCEQSL